ncbi:MAG: cobalamin biosynthesis protein, partial [Candidatus Promineifilaceae bacterium]
GKPAIDLLGQAQGWTAAAGSALTHVAACLVNGEPIGVLADTDQLAPLSDLLAQENVERVATLDELDVDAYAAGIIVSDAILSDHHQHVVRKSVLFRPKTLTVGMGCKRGVSADALRQALMTTLDAAGLSAESIHALATVDLKADEAGLIELATSLNVPLKIIEQSALATDSTSLDTSTLSPSAATEKFGLVGVAEPTALLVSNGTLTQPKRSFSNCTVAIARNSQR